MNAEEVALCALHLTMSKQKIYQGAAQEQKNWRMISEVKVVKYELGISVDSRIINTFDSSLLQQAK